MRYHTSGTRATDNPHRIVTRRVPRGVVVGGFVTVMGWVGFVAVALRCILTAPHP